MKASNQNRRREWQWSPNWERSWRYREQTRGTRRDRPWLPGRNIRAPCRATPNRRDNHSPNRRAPTGRRFRIAALQKRSVSGTTWYLPLPLLTGSSPDATRPFPSSCIDLPSQSVSYSQAVFSAFFDDSVTLSQWAITADVNHANAPYHSVRLDSLNSKASPVCHLARMDRQ